MPVFNLVLHQTYFNQGFFNVTVDFDRFIRAKEGTVKLILGLNGVEISGKINRNANQNGTARIMGGKKLRTWFQQNFKPLDKVSIDLNSLETIILYKKNENRS